MRWFERRRPSSAIVIACTALIIGLVGTAIAGPPSFLRLDKQEKSQVKRIASKQGEKQTRKLNRAVFARYDSLSNSSTTGPVSLSKSITAPVKGTLLINGSISFVATLESGITCLIKVEDEIVPGSLHFVTRVPDDTSADCGTTAAVEVGRGRYEVALAAGIEQGTPNFLDRTLTVQFVP